MLPFQRKVLLEGKVVEYIGVELLRKVLLLRKVVEYIGGPVIRKAAAFSAKGGRVYRCCFLRKLCCRIGIRWSSFWWIFLCGAGGILEKSLISAKVLPFSERCCF